MENLLNVDFYLLDAIQNLKCGFLDKFCVILTTMNEFGVMWILIAFLLLFSKKTRKIGITMGVTLLLGVILGNGLIKNIVDRPRPYDYDRASVTWDTIRNIPVPPFDASFPSGHTLSSFGAAVAVLFYDKKWGIAALITAVLMGFSRMYQYVHFPSDVLGGIILGIGFGIASFYIVKAAYPFFEKKFSAGNL